MSLVSPSFAPPSTRSRVLRTALSRPLGPVRMAGLAAAVMAAAYGVVLVRAAVAGLWFRPPHDGTGLVDFAEFWGAGRLVLHGAAADAYDWTRLRAEISHGFGAPVPASLPFLYPPPLLLFIAPLGALPYAAAFQAWTAAGLLAYVAAVRSVSREWTALAVALAAPGVVASLMVGQNGLFTAALLGAGLALLDRRPWAAGALLGALCVKPQLAVLVPVALVAGGRWKSLAAAAASAALLAAIAALLLGPATYLAFIKAGAHAQADLAGAGAVGWGKIQTIYGLARSVGATAGAAGLLQGAVSLAATAAVGALWRGRAPAALKAAGLVAAVPLATPYAFMYDAALLGPGVVFVFDDLRRRGVGRRVEPLLLAVAALLPAAYFAVGAAWLPFASLALAAVVALRLRPLEEPSRRITANSPAPSHPGAAVEASS